MLELSVEIVCWYWVLDICVGIGCVIVGCGSWVWELGVSFGIGSGC